MPSELHTVRADLRRRLRCAEGHLHGISRMIETGADDEEVLGQLLAVQGALRGIVFRSAAQHLGDCLQAALQAADPAARECALGKVVALYAIVRNGRLV